MVLYKWLPHPKTELCTDPFSITSSRNVDVQTQEVYTKYLKAVLHPKYSVQAIFTVVAGVALSSTHSLTHSPSLNAYLTILFTTMKLFHGALAYTIYTTGPAQNLVSESFLIYPYQHSNTILVLLSSSRQSTTKSGESL